MSEDFKSNFVTADIEKPMAELEELNNLVKKKKAEVRKAMFYAKHPDLLQAKKEYEAKMSSVNAEKFNEAIAEPKQVQVKEEPAPAPAPAPIQATIPAPVPIQKPAVQVSVPMSVPAPQHTHVPTRPLVVGLNSRWF